MADVAVISVVTSGAVGFGGLAFGVWNAINERRGRREAREFSATTARTERIEGRRAEVYVEVLADLEREVFAFERIYPIMTPAPPAPDQLSDEEWIHLKSRLAAFGSEAVTDLTRTFYGVSTGFIEG